MPVGGVCGYLNKTGKVSLKRCQLRGELKSEKESVTQRTGGREIKERARTHCKVNIAL